MNLNIFHVQAASVGGTCKAALLATAADSELLTCSNSGVDGLFHAEPSPCFPSGCEMGKMECHPVGAGRERVQ